MPLYFMNRQPGKSSGMLSKFCVIERNAIAASARADRGTECTGVFIDFYVCFGKMGYQSPRFLLLELGLTSIL